MAKAKKAKSKAKGYPSAGFVPLPGKRIPISIKKQDDRWSEFKLADGTTVKLRPLVIDVHRVQGQFAPDGQPVYEIKGGSLLEISAPPKLRKK